MGWLSSAWKSVKGVVIPAAAGVVGGPAAAAAAAAIVNRPRPVQTMPAMEYLPASTPSYFPTARPGSGYTNGYQTTGAAIGGAARALPRIAQSPAGRAIIGTAVGAAGSWIYDQFGNPVRRKRRRSRGISGVELRNFRRVTKFLTKYTPAVRRMATAKVMHRKG